MAHDVFEALDLAVEQGWATIKRGAYWTHVMEHGYDVRLAQRTLVELYHYTRHNSINQAVAAYRVPAENHSLLHFCYNHAAEELGHEKMVVHDLEALGALDPSMLEAPPLPATQALIGYLYAVALGSGAVPRLGYSYWAESAYDHIGPLIGRLKEDLGATDRDLSFFVAHGVIDVKHAAEVREAIERHVVSEEHRRAVVEVARTSLYLTGALLEGAFHAVHEPVGV